MMAWIFRCRWTKALIILTALFVIRTALVRPPVAWCQEKQQFSLYFPHPDHSGLTLESRAVEPGANLTAKVINLVQALLNGPVSGLSPSLLTKIKVRQVFVDQNQTAYIDLIPGPNGAAATAGVEEERLILWALVNTIILNCIEIKQVKILVHGDEAPTLFGHIDLSRPLLPDPKLVK